MQIPVLIEPVASNGYRARGLVSESLSGEGATREEALHKLRQRLEAQLTSGSEIVGMDFPVKEHPLAKAAGIFQADDPLVQEWEQIMLENRKRADEELGIS